jgi:NTE family protein
MSTPELDPKLEENLHPVRLLESDGPLSKPKPGMALCLSGGGYRAMLFHLGALWRLNDLGLLKGLKKISSVSGGSITAGLLGLKWKQLIFDGSNVATNFEQVVVAPIRSVAQVTIDTGSIIYGILLPRHTVADEVAGAYREHLFGDATLQDLPSDDEGPRFVINATNVQTRVLWRFSKPFMGDYRVGLVRNPTTDLAVAVTASSAFPPFLSPVSLKLNPADFDPTTKGDLQIEPYTSEVVLTDGGVYDNLGLETAWKSYETILVSDGGGGGSDEPKPKRDWLEHVYRVLNLIDNQVRSLRKRQVVASYQMNLRKGAYWGIRGNILDYQLPDAMNCPFAQTLVLANTATRLKKMDGTLQERLINWGYAVSDAGLRRHLYPLEASPIGSHPLPPFQPKPPPPPPPTRFPYPDAGIG